MFQDIKLDGEQGRASMDNDSDGEYGYKHEVEHFDLTSEVGKEKPKRKR